MMFKQILYTQWKWSRAVLFPLVVAAFSLPLISVSRFGVSEEGVSSLLVAHTGMAIAQFWSPAFPLLALIGGALLAAASWRYDIQGNHVYSLTLPLPRSKYALYRMGAGALLALGLVATVWVGALVAVSAATIPEGWHTYPHSLASRFLLATMLAYTGSYWLSGLKRKTGIIVLASVLGTGVVLGPVSEWLFDRDVLSPLLVRLAVEWPGPLHVFTGNWMLVGA